MPPPPGVANVTQDYDDFHSVRTEAGRVRNKSTKEDRDLIEKKKKRNMSSPSLVTMTSTSFVQAAVVWCGVVWYGCEEA